jgi:hypothetical protein
MTTITIKNGFKNKNIAVKNPQEALKVLLDFMGYTYIMPLEDEDLNKKQQLHFQKNKNRPIEDYDNI